MKYKEEEKILVEYLKEKLKSRGVLIFPRDWHLRNLAVARTMLEGNNSPSIQEWQKCIDWAFGHEYWGDKVDHLARVFSLWPRYVMQHKKRKAKTKEEQENKQKKEIIKKLYLS
jgi:hypothetical protein